MLTLSAERPHTGGWLNYRPSAGATYVVASVVVAAVNDGWSGRPSPLRHQLVLIPFTILFGAALLLLFRSPRQPVPSGVSSPFLNRVLGVSVAFEVLSIASLLYARHHFSRFGYAFSTSRLALVLGLIAICSFFAFWRRTGGALLAGVLGSYSAALLLAISSFPLNYLRSDMLPVTVWADRRLIRGMDPYTTMHVGSRIYDFPYLPGVLVAYLPVVAAHWDPRLLNLVCVISVGLLIFRASLPPRRLEAAALVGVFVLSPFLQYRHDLYLAPHWLCLTAALVLSLKRRHLWASFVFGLSMAVYQLSWVMFPFFVLYAYRRGRWPEAVKACITAVVGALVLVGPFLSQASHRIASNTVGQWSRLPHALADPMNISYWLTYLVRPDQLKWVQLGVMSALFLFCVARGRCTTLRDTLRFMGSALALFVAMNVIVDGYFYLTVLLVLLMFTCIQTGIWSERDENVWPSCVQNPCGEP